MNASVLGIPKRYTARNLDEIIAFAGLEESIDAPVRFYSSGMYARLGFAVAVNVDPDIVLIDEVLAVGDSEFQERCISRMELMKDEGRTMILVTHSREQANSFAQRTIALNHGRVVYDGPSAGYGEGTTELAGG